LNEARRKHLEIIRQSKDLLDILTNPELQSRLSEMFGATKLADLTATAKQTIRTAAHETAPYTSMIRCNFPAFPRN
jgi:hypothetical protein